MKNVFVILVLLISSFCNSTKLLKEKVLASLKEKTRDDANYSTNFTPWNDRGDGKIYYLDRHKIMCSTSFLTGFALKRNDNQIRYEYQCTKKATGDSNDQKTDHTPANDINKVKDGQGNWNGQPQMSVNFLDRHNVQCPSGYGLMGFNLVRIPQQAESNWTTFWQKLAEGMADPVASAAGDLVDALLKVVGWEKESYDKIMIEFKCMKITSTTKACNTVYTDWSYGDTGATEYLDRQQIFYKGLSIITGFKLEAKYEGNDHYYRYNIAKCDL